MAPPLDVFSESFTNYFESLKINTQYCTYLIILITLCVCVCIYCLNCTVPFWFVSLSIPVAILNRFVSSIISIFIHLRCFPFCLVNKQTKKKQLGEVIKQTGWTLGPGGFLLHAAARSLLREEDQQKSAAHRMKRSKWCCLQKGIKRKHFVVSVVKSALIAVPLFFCANVLID